MLTDKVLNGWILDARNKRRQVTDRQRVHLLARYRRNEPARREAERVEGLRGKKARRLAPAKGQLRSTIRVAKPVTRSTSNRMAKLFGSITTFVRGTAEAVGK